MAMSRQSGFDGKTIVLLQKSGAVKTITIKVDSSVIYVQYQLRNSEVGTAHTTAGKVKQSSTVDAVVKWLKSLGFGQAQITFANWQFNQSKLKV